MTTCYVNAKRFIATLLACRMKITTTKPSCFCDTCSAVAAQADKPRVAQNFRWVYRRIFSTPQRRALRRDQIIISVLDEGGEEYLDSFFGKKTTLRLKNDRQTKNRFSGNFCCCDPKFMRRQCFRIDVSYTYSKKLWKSNIINIRQNY